MSSSALQVARTGLDAQEFKMRVIANNLANVNTTGFKRNRASFETLAYQQMVTPGAQATAENKYAIGTNVGTGVRITGTERMVEQGSIQSSGNALDMAIEGEGHFQIQQPDGTIAYTRDGNFSVSADGTIVTSDGKPLIPQITIPNDAIVMSVGSDGTVSITRQGEAGPIPIGQVEIARFINPAGLTPIGNNLLLASGASGDPQVGAAGAEGRGQIRGGALEQSNVNTVEELVDMIETQRAYEVASKMIKSTDEMMQFANQQI